MPTNQPTNNNNSNSQFLLFTVLIAGFFISTAAWRTYLDNAPKTESSREAAPSVEAPQTTAAREAVPPDEIKSAEVKSGALQPDEAPDEAAPEGKVLSPNAYDFYRRAALAILDADSSDGNAPHIMMSRQPIPSQLNAAEKKKLLAENALPLTILRQGVEHPCDIPYLLSPFSVRGGAPQRTGPRGGRPEPNDYLLSRMFYPLAQLLVIDSQLRGERGDWSGAADSLIDLQKFGHDLSHDSGGITPLAGQRIRQMAFSELLKIFPRLNAAQTKAVVKRWESILENRVSFADVLREEKQGRAQLLQRHLELNPGQVAGASGNSLKDRLLKSMPLQKWKINQVVDEFEVHMDTLIARAEAPFDPRASEPIEPKSLREIRLPIMFGHTSFRPFRERYWEVLSGEVRESLLLTAMALRAYRLEQNRYPQSLNQLAPGYLKEVPRDVFGSREPLKYVQPGAEYSLYSIGPDGVDDSGRAVEYKPYPDRPISEASRYQISPLSRGDIVMGVNIQNFARKESP